MIDIVLSKENFSLIQLFLHLLHSFCYFSIIQFIIFKEGNSYPSAPDAEKTINYQIPTITLHGNSVRFAPFKKHIGFYSTPSAIEKFKKELSAFEGAKDSIKFRLDRPIPFTLIGKILKYRVKKNVE